MNPVIFLFEKMWYFSKGNRGSVVLYTGLFLISNILIQLQPLVIGYIFNLIQGQSITSDTIWSLVGLLAIPLLLVILFWSLHGPARYIETKNAFLVRANYKQYLLRGTMGLPVKWHTNHHSGDTIDKIEKGTTALYEFSESTFWILEGIIMLIVAYAALTIFNVHASYIVLLLLFGAITFILYVDKTLIKQYRQLNHYENKVSERIYDVLSNISTVIILRVEKQLQKGVWKKILDPFDLHKKNSALNEKKWATVSFISGVMIFLVLASYVFSSYQTGILIGTVYILYEYVNKISNLFYRFAWQYGQVVRRATAIQNAEEISVHFEPFAKKKIIDLKRWHSLTIKNLTFHYHDFNSDLHLRDISMTIRRGEKIALIGESGSGKTTLLKVMRELYTPKNLRLEIDGMHLPKGFASISSHISLIPQDPEIFTTTIKENITVGIPHTEKYIKKFTDLSRFTKVIPLLPRGLLSSINERGVNLSGGQKQRLALARGLLASVDKEIILLDEPTSSVDPENERAIYKNILSEFRKKTIISAIHRIHLLPLFDTIYWMKNGSIYAVGSYEELKKRPDFIRLIEKTKD